MASSETAAETLSRTEIRFRSGEADCAGVSIRPATSEPAPCVVLAHGFGAVKEGGPIRSAERFAAAGFAALAFDYRHFGESGGEQRQLLSAKRQLEDWRAAIAHARTLDGVDPDRIGLWGSSYSGGHVIALAADDPSIKAAISQSPHTDGIRTLFNVGPSRNGATDLRRPSRPCRRGPRARRLEHPDRRSAGLDCCHDHAGRASRATPRCTTRASSGATSSRPARR